MHGSAGTRFHPFWAWLVAQLLYISVDVNTILTIIMSTFYLCFQQKRGRNAENSRSPNPEIDGPSMCGRSGTACIRPLQERGTGHYYTWYKEPYIHGSPAGTEFRDTLIQPPVRSRLPPLGLTRHDPITRSPAASPDRLRALCVQ